MRIDWDIPGRSRSYTAPIQACVGVDRSPPGSNFIIGPRDPLFADGSRTARGGFISGTHGCAVRRIGWYILNLRSMEFAGGPKLPTPFKRVATSGIARRVGEEFLARTIGSGMKFPRRSVCPRQPVNDRYQTIGLCIHPLSGKPAVVSPHHLDRLGC